MKAARKKLWGWYFFDWATQPYSTLMLTFVFGPFFATIASEVYMGSGLAEQAADAKAQSLWSLCLTIIGLIVGFGAPFMGAVADVTGRRLPWIVGFSILYIAGSMSLWWTQPDGSNMLWMLCAFGVGFIGAEFALIFTNAQLPSLGPTKLIGKISGTGFAFGYIGGLVSLVIMLLFFLEQPSGKTLFGIDPAFGLDAAQREGTRFVGPLTAAWFLIFMIPYFRSVRDTPKDPSPDRVYQALGTLVETLKGLRHKISLSAYLGSSMFYRDALNGLYGFGGTYAVLVLNWELTYLGVFGIISIIAAALFCWVGGKIDAYTGPKPLIIITIWSLIAVCLT
ncbi:MAG: MFS transporter, partial [Marinovum sp.]|nr:MFS transporter [Marinovum sp.]